MVVRKLQIAYFNFYCSTCIKNLKTPTSQDGQTPIWSKSSLGCLTFQTPEHVSCWILGILPNHPAPDVLSKCSSWLFFFFKSLGQTGIAAYYHPFQEGLWKHKLNWCSTGCSSPNRICFLGKQIHTISSFCLNTLHLCYVCLNQTLFHHIKMFLVGIK